MRPLSKLLAVALCWAVAVEPCLAAVQSAQVNVPGNLAPNVGLPVQLPLQIPGSASLGLTGASSFGLNSSLPRVRTVAPTLTSVAAPSPIGRLGTAGQVVLPTPAVQPLRAVKSVAAQAAAPVQVKEVRPAPIKGEQSKTFAEKKIQPVAVGVAEAAEEMASAPTAGAYSAAAKQFSLLTGEGVSQSQALDVAAAPAVQSFGRSPVSLRRAAAAPSGDRDPLVAADAEVSAQAPPAKPSFGQVFKDPERNKSFWRYVVGTIVYYFGIEMYVVGLPFLVSAYTKNVLYENNDARLQNAELLKTVIRENRSVARIAHWIAQAFSYASIPLFTRNMEHGPKTWLVRSALIRAGILALLPTLFFASGIFSLQTALWTLFGLIAVQSFFQGLYVTMDTMATTRLFGDKSVTAAERMKANSILTFIAAATAIIGPAIAGQISLVKDFFGKTGVGAALIYGIYALATGIAGLIYATVGIIGKKAAADEAASGVDAPAKKGFKSVLKDLAVSLKDGIKIIWKSRFLRTLTVLSLIISLFSDPLVFNVFPEFVEGILAANPGTLNWILQIPVIGWLFKGLTSTPMGYYSLMVVFFSVGNILASMFMEPLRKLFKKLGFKNEESLTIPLYVMAALEAPLFWVMISYPSMWGILMLYGMQALATAFSGIAVAGLHQKTLGELKSGDVSKVLAAESFLGIIAAIIATYVYGFVLTGIPIATSLLIAAIATTVLAALRLAAPWLYFTKEQRNAPPPEEPSSS
ncbi:MAG: hypothetical protein WC728_12870 [Elusimicrobiota bacterium]